MSRKSKRIDQDSDYLDVAAAVEQLNEGANWFFWVVVLSAVNSFIALSDGDRALAIGLGITQIIDAVFRESVGTAIFFDLLVSGLFILLGRLSRQRVRKAMILGMVLYFLDALIFFPLEGYLSITLHGYVLFKLFQGYQALRALKSA